jgi:hypothetical protein
MLTDTSLRNLKPQANAYKVSDRDGHLLLIGAGFSRNWGGWLANEAFEYLLGCPEIVADEELRQLLWSKQTGGGFETALAELQRDFERSGDGRATEKLNRFQTAIGRMFEHMNAAFTERPGLQFHHEHVRSLGGFLARFDAIFSLNQDLLLEHYYLSGKMFVLNVISGRKWGGCALPGMQSDGEPKLEKHMYADTWAFQEWRQLKPTEFLIVPDLQPCFKLHGSSNWFAPTGQPLLIMGGDKVRDISLHPILCWYAEVFERMVSEVGCKLMIVGYSFRDPHINDVITRAIDRTGLRIFVIDPQGSELARSLNPTNIRPVRVEQPLEQAFRRALIGASRRPLTDTFGTDAVEYKKVMRFFETAGR